MAGLGGHFPDRAHCDLRPPHLFFKGIVRLGGATLWQGPPAGTPRWKAHRINATGLDVYPRLPQSHLRNQAAGRRRIKKGTICNNEEGKAITSSRKKQTPDSSKLLELVETTLNDDKAQDIVVIDLAGKTTLADFMVVACGRSARQVAALAGKMQEKLKHTGYGKVPVEGLPQSDWVLVDAGDVIIHLFRPEVREFYNLEKMWSELAPSEDQLGEESLAADEDDWAAV